MSVTGEMVWPAGKVRAEAMAWGSDDTSVGGTDYLRMRNKLKQYTIRLLQEKTLPDF